MTDPVLLAELMTLVEPGKVLTDAASLEADGKDWTKHFPPAPSAIVFPKDIEEAIDKIANRSRYRAYTDEKGITYYPWAWVKFYLLKVVTGQDDKAIAKFIGGPQGKQAIEYQDEAPELIRQKVESGSIRVKALLDCLRHNEAQRGAEPLTGLLGTAAQQFRKARFWGLPPR